MQFGTDGVRGVALTELTTEFATRLGRAAARVLGADGVTDRRGRRRHPRVAPKSSIGRSATGSPPRASTWSASASLRLRRSPSKRNAVARSVRSCRRRTTPGPTTASSCSPEAARSSPTKSKRRIEAELAARGRRSPTRAGAVGSSTPSADHDAYVDHVVGVPRGSSTSTACSIVLDAANGAAHQIGPEVLRAAGADVIVVADSPDGRNINDGCGATAPSLVADAVLDARRRRRHRARRRRRPADRRRSHRQGRRRRPHHRHRRQRPRDRAASCATTRWSSP